jgi:hypothetical protein
MTGGSSARGGRGGGGGDGHDSQGRQDAGRRACGDRSQQGGLQQRCHLGPGERRAQWRSPAPRRHHYSCAKPE